MVEEKASSGDPTPSVLLESVLAYCYELWFLNVSLLGNDQTQTADTRILLKDYCGFFRHKNKKKGVKIWFPHFPELYVHILKDETEDISGSFDV